MTICLSVNTLYYPNGGGHMWVYLNWALGFLANGCNVIWLEAVNAHTSPDELVYLVASLKERLEEFELQDDVALWPRNGDENNLKNLAECMDVSTAAEQADILINQWYGMPQNILNKFKRTVLLDIDPGLTQVWLSKGYIHVAPHDVYFTIGETVGKPGAKFPDLGLKWNYTAPCVALDRWPVFNALEKSTYTTVSHWSMDLWEDDNGELYSNDKKVGFLPYLQLPKHVTPRLELALCLAEWEKKEKEDLENFGWYVSDSQTLTSTPEKYQRYIQSSRGEFSCVKPSCIRLQNAWISDRTICYLASGKPAIVEHTGPSRFLPDNAGLLRFRNFDEAVKCIKEVEANYERHSQLARSLAEEYFDAKKVAKSLLERSL